MKSDPPPDVVAELGTVDRLAPTADVTGAALRSIFIGALLLGGLGWVVRVALKKKSGQGAEQKRK
jgi:hypothetical protein